MRTCSRPTPDTSAPDAAVALRHGRPAVGVHLRREPGDAEPGGARADGGDVGGVDAAALALRLAGRGRAPVPVDPRGVQPEGLQLGEHEVVAALADRAHGHDRGDADRDAEHAQRGAQPMVGERAHGLREGVRQIGVAHGADPSRRTVHARTSSTTHPSRSVTRRPARAAISGSWVTIRIVRPRACSSANSRHDALAGGAVEVAGRLVGDDHVRIVHQRPGDRHALALTAGEFGGAVVHAVLRRRPDRLEAAGAARGPSASPSAPGARSPPGPVRPAGVDQRQRHVAERVELGDQVEALEHEARGGGRAAARAPRRPARPHPRPAKR